ncbi:uncharacterized protein LOC129548630 [Moschus berezovskii]|uniref:uncharacterized protein LOC129548630 n=1 Tax=Moschus berezovskii TaxID=68408 RepID=UPI0024448DB6|nr:uncharacterized protein LOC129548630 [Moschus berezovskii]
MSSSALLRRSSSKQGLESLLRHPAQRPCSSDPCVWGPCLPARRLPHRCVPPPAPSPAGDKHGPRAAFPASSGPAGPGDHQVTPYFAEGEAGLCPTFSVRPDRPLAHLPRVAGTAGRVHTWSQVSVGRSWVCILGLWGQCPALSEPQFPALYSRGVVAPVSQSTGEQAEAKGHGWAQRPRSAGGLASRPSEPPTVPFSSSTLPGSKAREKHGFFHRARLRFS